MFCAPRSSIDNPSLRPATHAVRSFAVLGVGAPACGNEESEGYWVEDDETGEVGFRPEFKDVFWQVEEDYDAWTS